MSRLLKSGKRSVSHQQLVLVIFLWLLVLFCSVTVVYAAYDTRNKFNELEELRAAHNDLQIKWGQYLLEESAWASFGRIEKVAVEQLGMRVPDATHVVMVNDDE